ncbi:MAG: histidine--tRNA ligase [Phycisphaerales bacterium]
MAKSGSKKIQPPKGTRDLYPEDVLRQRYITEAWRRVSIRHGFEEIAGPTFEMLELYKKKSGEGIVSELFSFKRAGGDDDYALRPEFTPTLARMYAEKANSLPSPCKWFTAGPYFRAEKPQRGRLREFLQWNCDVMGGDDQQTQLHHDLETITVIITMLVDLGLSSSSLLFRVSDRHAVARYLQESGVAAERIPDAFALLDKRAKLDTQQFAEAAVSQSLDLDKFDTLCAGGGDSDGNTLRSLAVEADREWMVMDYSIVRGLAYYTGTVFELIADGERAVAGGGRYDNLIELFGGPPTPAVGFGMGDVVFGLLLEDKGLMPEGPELADAVSQKPASVRPEAFVIANEAGEPHIEPLLAELRRGRERAGFDGKPWDPMRYEVQPMHARRSYKSTKNIGKLLGDARKQHAKFAVIIESDEAAKVENLETREDLGTFALDKVGAVIAERL